MPPAPNDLVGVGLLGGWGGCWLLGCWGDRSLAVMSVQCDGRLLARLLVVAGCCLLLLVLGC